MISIEWEVRMTQETLKQAISLSRAGKKLEARELLEGILKADPQQEAAWLWFADTYQSAGRRLQVLDTALHMNPDSQMVAQARDALLVASGFQPQRSKETPPPAEKPPVQETRALQDTTNLYLAFDSEKRVWRVTTAPQAVEEKVEEKPAAPPAEPAKTEQELLDELMALQMQEMKSEPSVEQLHSEQEDLDKLIELQLEAEKSQPSSVEQLQSDQEELDKLIALQLQQQSAPVETPASTIDEQDEDELDPDIIVAESFVELLQAELETGEKEAPPDWMDTEARRIEQLISLADKESSSSDNEPPAEPAEALQWVPESETAKPEQPAEAEESTGDEQPAPESNIEDTQQTATKE